MTLSNLSDRKAVQEAIQEFNELGREHFLKKYGFGKARKYFLLHRGARYDSKAICGVAYGYQYPERGPLTNQEFSGGETTVAKHLRELGFEVTTEDYKQRIWAFCANPSRYRITEAVAHMDVDYWTIGRSDVKAGDFAVVWQTTDGEGRRGIVTLGDILADPEEISDSYNKYWVNPADEQGAKVRVPLRYITAPNLPLWVTDTPEGEFLLSLNVARARGGTVFRVTNEQWQRIEYLAGAFIQPEQEKVLWEESLEMLRERALASSKKEHSPQERKVVDRYRSNAIRVYVLKRANGFCEECEAKAPFQTKVGRPYLEPHHIRRLSDGGPDDPNWVIALCPNCHRRAHYGQDRADYNHRLTRIVQSIEEQLV